MFPELSADWLIPLWKAFRRSVFFADGHMGHTSYVLLILSSLMRRMFWLRAFFIASALTGISYSVFWLADPVGVF